MRLLVHFGFRGHLLSTAQPTCFRKTQCVMMCVCDAANVVIRWSMLAHCQFAVGLEEPRFNALVNDHYDIIAIVLCLWVYLPCKISVTCESTIRFNVWGSRESPSLLSSMPLVNQYVNNYNNIQRATIAYPLPLVQHAACCRSVARWIVVVHRCCWLQKDTIESGK